MAFSIKKKSKIQLNNITSATHSNLFVQLVLFFHFLFKGAYTDIRQVTVFSYLFFLSHILTS